MFRYEEADENLTEVFLNVLEKYFPVLQFLKFKLIYDTKKRVSKGKIILASIETASPKIKFLSKDKIAIDGYDLLLIADQKIWQVANEKDKIRLLRHELKHVQIDEKGGVTIVGHEIEDFYSEIEANRDDPEWRMRLITYANDLYDQEKLMRKEGK